MTKTIVPSGKVKLLEVTSPAFGPGEYIPAKYTCRGKDVNPPLSIRNIPEGTRSLAIIVDDPDAPAGTWVHWIVWNIPPGTHIGEDSNPGIEGLNDYKRNRYSGPCPPSGTHHYHFKVFAMDDILSSTKNISIKDMEKIMKPHVIGFGELVGLFSM